MKYFISYTLKDSCINKHLLLKIKEFYLKKNINTYIDILDNIHLNSSDYFLSPIQINKNINELLISPSQKYLQAQLILCNKLIILISPSTFKSNWIQEEILFATKHKIPICYISISYFLTCYS